MATTTVTKLTSTQTNTTTSYVQLNDLSFSASTGITYFVQWNGTMTTSGSTSGATGGMKFRLNTPTGESNLQFLGATSANVEFRSDDLLLNGDVTGTVCTAPNDGLIWRVTGLVTVTTPGLVSLSFRCVNALETAKINKLSSMVVIF